VLGDVDRPVGRDRELRWRHLRLSGRSAVTGVAPDTGAREGADGPIRRHTTNPVVERIGDQEAAVGLDCDVGRSVEERLACRSAVTARAALVAAVVVRISPGDLGDVPVRPAPQDALVVEVGDVERAVGTEVQPIGGAEVWVARRVRVGGHHGRELVRCLLRAVAHVEALCDRVVGVVTVDRPPAESVLTGVPGADGLVEATADEGVPDAVPAAAARGNGC